MPAAQPVTSKREELVDIASALFYAQGYGATGIKQIIDEAGIAKGTFYSHFTSKEELGLAWLKKRHLVWNRWLDEKVDQAKGGKSKILALFDFLESWMGDCNYRGCAFLNTLAEVPDPSHPMREEIVDHKRGLQEKIESLVKAHFEGKPSTVIKQQSAVIFLLFEGAIVETQNFRGISLIAAARKQVKSLLTSP